MYKLKEGLERLKKSPLKVSHTFILDHCKYCKIDVLNLASHLEICILAKEKLDELARLGNKAVK